MENLPIKSLRLQCILICIFFLINTVASAQLEHFTIEHITKVTGLSSTEITGIVQDDKGVMWIATRDGLNRYDGYSVKVYQNSSLDTTSLCDNIITALFLDGRGNLWVGTESNGVSFYDRQKDAFINYHNDVTDPTSLSCNYVTSIEEDNYGRIWFGTLMGLNLFQTETNNFKRFFRSLTITIWPPTLDSLKKEGVPKFLIEGLSKIVGKELELAYMLEQYSVKPYLKTIFDYAQIENSGLSIKALKHDDLNNLWIGFEKEGLGKMNLKDFRLERFEAGPGQNKISSDRILTLCWVDKELWIGTTDGGVNIFNPHSGLFRRVFSDLKPKFVKCIMKDLSNRVWIGSDIGILVRKIGTDSLTKIDFPRQGKLFSEDVSAIFEDSQHNFWIASYQGGINVLKNSKAFNQYVFFETGVSENRSKTVSSILEDAEGNIWVGFFIGGIEVIKKGIKNRIYFNHDARNTKSLGLGSVHKIFEDSKHNIWVGTYEGGLQRFDKMNKEFISYNFNDGTNSIKDVRDIAEDGAGSLWLAVHGDGIKKIDLKTNSISHYRANYRNWKKSLSSDWVFAIHCDTSGRIIAGSVSGVSILDPVSGKFQSYTKANSNLSHDRVQAIQQDQLGQIWIGTQNGLNLFIESERKFMAFHVKEGLPNNCINGILEDSGMNLWISTNNGLSKFSRFKKVEFTNYYDCDGISSNEFFQGAFAIGKTGNMLFGTKNGLTLFNPTDIKPNTFKPPVFISEFKIFNKKVPIEQSEDAVLTKSIGETKKIVLAHDQNMLSFEFVAVNYIVPERNSYAYKMEGFEENWNYVGSKREATYAYLNPGNYIFKVKASNNDGIWNEEGTSIMVEVKPPIWYSLWAVVLYFIIGVTVLYFLRRTIMERIKEKGRVEMNEMKLRFFASISHEFRTPLTLIIGPLNQLNCYFKSASKDQKELFEIIKRNCRRLLKLTNQLMNIYEFDAGCMRLSVRENEMVEFTRRIINEFQSTALERNIYYHFISNTPEVWCWFDSDKVEKILVNIISNAFKYTPDNGSIVVYFTLLDGEHLERVPKQIKSMNTVSRYIKITIEDNGKGISPQFTDKIFDRFFRIDDNESKQEGSGLGLYLAKQLAKIHRGDIIVSSAVDKGSNFIIWLPVDRGAFLDSEIESNMPESEALILELQKYQIESEEQITNFNDKNLPVMLIVEDNSDLRSFLKINFKSRFYVHEAGDGDDGFKMALKLIPDIIISDVMMPVLDGVELCYMLKKHEQTKQIPVILLTAKVGEDFQIEALRKSGADDYITKPFNIEILSIKIKNCLEYRESLRKKLHMEFSVKPTAVEIQSSEERFIRNIVEIVEKNMSDVNFDINKLCEELAMSQTNLYRKLQSLLGISGAHLIKSVRLKKAAQLIKAKRYSVSEVANLVGFNDPKYFSKSFRKQFGLLPSEYLENFESEVEGNSQAILSKDER